MKRALAAGCCLALALAATFLHAVDQQRREPVRVYARRFGFDVRRPLWVEQAELEPSADFAAAALAGAALLDELGSVGWADLTPSQREAWLTSIEEREEELRGAARLLLAAIAENPGWPFHTMQLGQLTYLADRRADSPELVGQARRWLVPLAQAVRRAPGVEAAFAFLGGALLDTWDGLAPDVRRDAPPILGRAFSDPSFVATSFRKARDLLGLEQALALVPPVPASLQKAQVLLAAEGDGRGAAAARLRWEEAERAARRTDLARLEERLRRGDTDALRAGCRSWGAHHRPAELDDEEGRRQAARILALWPHDTVKPWLGDPRAELVRHFLNGRLESAEPEALERAVRELSDVPEPVRARVALRAGDRYGFGKVVRDSESAGSLEWTPVFTDLAAAALAAGSPREAREALARIAPPAREECAVLLVRRAVARAGADSPEEAEVRRLLEEARALPVGPQAWSRSGSLSLCVDPEADEQRLLEVTLRAPAPALLAWGWNGGRARSRLVEGEEVLAFPLRGLQGRVTLSLSGLAGGRAEVVAAARR